MKKELGELTLKEIVEKKIPEQSVDCMVSLSCKECPFNGITCCWEAVQKFFSAIILDLEVEVKD